MEIDPKSKTVHFDNQEAEFFKRMIQDSDKINYYHGKLMDSYFTLWSNLINTDAISLSAFSIIIAIYDNIPNIITNFIFPSSLIITLISILMLIENINYYKKSNYEVIESFFTPKKKTDISEFIKETDHLVKRTKRMKAIELIARLVFIVNIVMIAVTIILSR